MMYPLVCKLVWGTGWTATADDILAKVALGRVALQAVDQ
jgi:hypothetical protein